MVLGQKKLKERMINFYLLRGMSRESAHWGCFQNTLEMHFPGQTIVQMDLPGFGQLNNINSPKNMEDIIKVLKTSYYVNSESINILIASSFAANVALKWGSQHAQDFHGLILLSPSIKGICTFTERVQPRSWFNGFMILFHPSEMYREKKLLQINMNQKEMQHELLQEWKHIRRIRPFKHKNVIRQILIAKNFEMPKIREDIPILICGRDRKSVV